MSEQGPAFNPFEAGSENKPSTLIDDKQKAEVMAHEANEARTDVARVRRVGSVLVDEFVNNPNATIAGLDARKDELVATVDASKSQDKEALKDLRDVQDALKVRESSGTIEDAIKNVTMHITTEERKADVAEDAAGFRYDKAKEMRASMGIKEKQDQ